MVFQDSLQILANLSSPHIVLEILVTLTKLQIAKKNLEETTEEIFEKLTS